MTVATDHPFHLRHARALAALTGLVILTVASGCGPATTAVATPPPTPRTEVVLTNFKVSGLPDTASAGNFNLTVSNRGIGEHELLVFKSDLAPAQYPVDSAGNVLEADSTIVKVSDAPNIPAGKSQQRTLVLAGPGRYLFFCNLPGHFKAGMYKVVTVN